MAQNKSRGVADSPVVLYRVSSLRDAKTAKYRDETWGSKQGELD